MNPHPQIYQKIAGLSYRNARKYLKLFGCTKSEQNKILSEAKNRGFLLRGD